jgi:hypothetical protein
MPQQLSGGVGYSNDTPNPMWNDSPSQAGTTPSNNASVKITCRPDFMVDPTTYDQFYFNTSSGAF